MPQTPNPPSYRCVVVLTNSLICTARSIFLLLKLVGASAQPLRRFFGAFMAVSTTALRALKQLRVGTDFSGVEVPILALKKLGLKFEHKFASDTLRSCRKFITHVTKPHVVYDRVEGRVLSDMPEVDVYAFSPPCQSFSNAGSKKGEADTRGQLVKHSLKFIKNRRPRLAVMENVKNLQFKFKTTLQKIRNALTGMGYNTFVDVLNTKQHGVPQNRERLYLVAIRADSMKHDFKFPAPFPLADGAALKLLETLPSDDPTRLPPKDVGECRYLVKKSYKIVMQNGIDPKRRFVAVDIDATEKFAGRGVDVLPTLTATRATTFGWWISAAGRRITLTEMFRFHGIDETDMIEWKSAGITERNMAHMLGNTVSLNVYERVLGRALWSAGLVAHKPVDRWP
jgi:DNA-cytosine methyltransferase